MIGYIEVKCADEFGSRHAILVRSITAVTEVSKVMTKIIHDGVGGVFVSDSYNEVMAKIEKAQRLQLVYIDAGEHPIP